MGLVDEVAGESGGDLGIGADDVVVSHGRDLSAVSSYPVSAQVLHHCNASAAR